MEYNDFEIIKPNSFEEIAKAYSEAKNKENIKIKQKMLNSIEKLEILKNSYSFLSKKGFNLKRKTFFKRIEAKTITQISLLSNEKNAKSKSQLVLPLTCKNLIKAELSLIYEIMENHPPIDIEIVELIKDRLNIIEKLVNVQA